MTLKAIISVHFVHRELDGKLLLAHEFAEQYGSAVIGRTSICRALMKRGYGDVLFDVVASPKSAVEFKEIRRDRRIIIIDEEASAWVNNTPTVQRIRFHKEACDEVNGFVSWGTHHDEIAPSWAAEKMLQTGNPRLELCRMRWFCLWEEETKVIQNSFPDGFVLFNSNLPTRALTNSPKETERFYKKLEKKVGFSDDYTVDLEIVKRSATEAHAIFLKTLDSACRVSSALGLPLVVRPHPTVPSALLRREIPNCSTRVSVDNRFSIKPWLENAAVVLHHNCTSSIESTLMGTPSIMLDGYDSRLSQAVKNASFSLTEEEIRHGDLQSLITHFASQTPKKQHDLRKVLHGIDSAVSRDIVDAATKGQKESDAKKPLTPSLSGRAEIIKGLVAREGLERDKRWGYHKNNDVPLAYTDVARKLRAINQTKGAKLKVRPIGRQLFEISRP